MKNSVKTYWENMDKWDSIWELLLFILVAILSLSLITGGILYSFSSKTHNGYYMYHENTIEFRIFINWENAPDECIYRSFSGEEILNVYERLQTQYNQRMSK